MSYDYNDCRALQDLKLSDEMAGGDSQANIPKLVTSGERTAAEGGDDAAAGADGQLSKTEDT